MKTKVPHIIKHVPIRGKKPPSTTPQGELKCVKTFHFLRLNQKVFATFHNEKE
jgi:hypothetical protein